MIPGITEHFPSYATYATLDNATISFEEMGDRVITAEVKIDGDTKPDFTSEQWALEYNGEMFILNTHTPQASKDNSSITSKVNLTFSSQPISELKRYFFVELSEITLGTVIIDKYIASLRLNARDFVTAFNGVLNYYFGDSFEVRIADGAEVSDDVKEVTIEYSYLWDVLAAFYDVYGLIWRIENVNGKYIIWVGESASIISDHVFQYGYSGGLTRIERQLEDADIYNQLLGRGGEKNLPYRYFKKADPNNTAFAADPDACAELKDVYFSNLLDINFRYYVKGWLRNPNRTVTTDYPTPTQSESADVRAHWAYQKGLTDKKFNPIEYVQDEASIAEYGVRQGKLDDDEDIYPTIQGITVDPYGRIDEMVAIGEITDYDDGGVTEELPLGSFTELFELKGGDSIRKVTFNTEAFSVPTDRLGQISYSWVVSIDSLSNTKGAYSVHVNTNESSVVAIRTSDGKEFPTSAIPGGDSYYLRIHCVLSCFPSDRPTIRNIGIQNVTLKNTLVDDLGNNPYTFKVWIKNVFQTEQRSGESDLEYAQRVWEPILGDRLGNEAKIVFSDGWMSTSSDYEFTIVDWPIKDRSKDINGVQSEWMLILAKSDAEYESTGKMFPNETSPKPVAGDHFYFTGIDMPYIYVVWAEKKLNEAKQAALDAKAYANPTWAIELDKVRIHTLEQGESETLMSKLRIGSVMQIYDSRYSGNEVLQLAIRSMTISWPTGTVMYPNVEVVLSENVLGRTSASESLSPSEIIASVNNSINKVYSAMSAQQKSYLSSEHEDSALGKINMLAGTSFGDYAEGVTGYGGDIDADGNAELNSLIVRHFLEVPEIRYNRISVQIGNKWNAPGGGIIDKVVPDYDSNGNMLNTGIIFLHLEDGEIGMVALDDICMGIYHDGINESSNALADGDDSIGNFHFSGFFTTYFRVTEILANDNHIFRYSIRPTSNTWTETHHPCEAMHFVGYGNFSDTTRQTSRYSTRTYERYLRGVNSWEFSAQNIGAQFGDLSNLSVFGLQMTGYSAYLNNIYMSGTIQQFANLPYRLEIDTGGVDTLGYGETLSVSCSVFKGWDDVTSQVQSWSIVRDSGNSQADTAWAQQSKVTSFNGQIDIAQSDLAAIGVSTLFTITATMIGGSTTNFSLSI